MPCTLSDQRSRAVQQQDGHAASVAAPLLQHAQPVFLRQANVQDHCVVRLAVTKEVTFLPVKSRIHHVPGIAQRRRKLRIEVTIIFNEENSHVACLRT
jgi:hypothetical protein